MQLVIANKNYSSWSMRPWVLMKGLGIPFEEVMVRFTLGHEAFGEAVRRWSPAGRVPVLIEDGDDGDVGDSGQPGSEAQGHESSPQRQAVWDSLAIVETLHERFPDRGVWPTEARARAHARSVCAEMHAGFGALRQAFPMNIELSMPDIGPRLCAEQPALRQDVARIEALWAEALQASGGPFLFGAFGAADAFFAPVALRFRSYGVPIGEGSRAYADRLLAAPGPAAWIAEALLEQKFVPEDEPYRSRR